MSQLVFFLFSIHTFLFIYLHLIDPILHINFIFICIPHICLYIVTVFLLQKIYFSKLVSISTKRFDKMEEYYETRKRIIMRN